MVHTPDPEGSCRGGARPQQLGGRSFVLSSGRCRPRSAVWPQPAPLLGRAAPSPLPFSAGRAIRVGPPSCGVITADLKADDVPTGADRSGTSSSRTGEGHGYLRAGRLLAAPPEPGSQAGAPGKRLCRRDRAALSRAQGVGRGAWTVWPAALTPRLPGPCVLSTRGRATFPSLIKSDVFHFRSGQNECLCRERIMCGDPESFEKPVFFFVFNRGFFIIFHFPKVVTLCSSASYDIGLNGVSPQIPMWKP